MENINDFQHTSFEVRSKGLKGFQSIHYIGHEIEIYFFSNKLQITMAGAKKLSNHQERKGLAKYSYPSCKVILSSPPSKKIQKLVKQQQQETSSERS